MEGGKDGSIRARTEKVIIQKWKPERERSGQRRMKKKGKSDQSKWNDLKG